MQLLTEEFLSRFPDFPEEMNALGAFVFLRTYSRYLEDKKRRETWKETVSRAVDYNVGLAIKRFEELKMRVPYDRLRKEAKSLFKNIFHLRQFLSGRTLWVGGAKNGVADKYPLANFNCSFLNVRKWEDLADLFYLLLVGTGVGFKCTKKFASELAPVRTDFTLTTVKYRPVQSEARLEHSVLRIRKARKITPDQEPHSIAYLYVGDSKEGWVEALRYFFMLISDPDYADVREIKINYDSVRPAGERLKTFGGTASGPDPLMQMFEGFVRVINNQIDPSLDSLELAYERDGQQYFRVRPIHILDMSNMIGYNVVVGGVRRTAEISLFDADDHEVLWAKIGVNGYWKQKDFDGIQKIVDFCEEHGISYPNRIKDYMQRSYDATVNVDHTTKEPRREEDGSLSPYNFGSGFYHRAMSNNSIAFTSKPDPLFMELIKVMVQNEGEPGFINLYEAARRRLAGQGITDEESILELIDNVMESIGLNPCAEILLWFYGVCNLTTLNLVQFVKNGKLLKEELLEAQRMSARAGLRMTLVTLELPHWDETQKRDALLGTSLTGVKDAMDLLGWDFEQEVELLDELGKVARREADLYAKEMRVTAPLLVTTVKPEGTLSQVAGGVSSGLHWSHSPYYIRRIRINALDPLAKAVKFLGWRINPENGTPGDTYEEKMKNAKTYVIDFPIASGAKRTKEDISVAEQFRTYFTFQERYTEHNSSNTITVKPKEWDELFNTIYSRWDEFVGVSFLSLDGGTYQLAPYEAITKEQYEELTAKMTPFDMNVLNYYDNADGSELSDEACEGGACPTR